MSQALRGRQWPWYRWALVPGSLAAVAILFLAVVGTARLSLFEWGGFGPARYVGIGHFRDLLVDASVLKVLARSLLFGLLSAGISIIVGCLLAFGIAMERRRGLDVWIVLPYLVAPGVYAASWLAALSSYSGWLHSALHAIQVAPVEGWLGSTAGAFYATVGVAVLHSSGFVCVVLLAAIRSSDGEPLEAALVDGASFRQALIRISLPALRPVLGILFALQFLWGFLVFDYVFALTGGGPGTSTDTVSTLAFSRAFEFGRYGSGAALATTAGLLSAGAALLVLRRRITETNEETGSSRVWDEVVPSIASVATKRSTTLVAWTWLLVASVPMAGITLNSFRSNESLLKSYWGWPDPSGTIANFTSAWSGTAIGQSYAVGLRNTLVVTVVAVAICVGLGLLTAFGSSLAPRGISRLAMGAAIVVTALPTMLLWIPAFHLAVRLGVLNEPVAVGVLYGVLGAPIAFLLLHARFVALRTPYIDMSRMDGATESRALMHVGIPMCRFEIGVAAMWQAIVAWNELSLASVLLQSGGSRTLTVEMAAFQGQFNLDVGAQSALFVLAWLPAPLFVVIVRRRGWTFWSASHSDRRR